jgi:hypothetical protein
MSAARIRRGTNACPQRSDYAARAELRLTPETVRSYNQKSCPTRVAQPSFSSGLSLLMALAV